MPVPPAAFKIGPAAYAGASAGYGITWLDP
jgi:hypothetical protein